jgi:lipocalin
MTLEPIKCKKEIDALELQVSGNDVVKNAFDNKTWYCHKQTLTPSYQNPDMTDVTAHYKLNNGVVQIKNCGIRANGKQRCFSFLRAKLPKGETHAKFIVKLLFKPSFLERKTNYWILDQTKEHMIVSAGNPAISESDCIRRPAEGQGLWILTNSKIRDDKLIDNAVNKIKELGINPEDMKDIVHKID